MRILHFSDFHITKEGISNAEANVDRMTNAILQNVKDDGPLVDIILYTGDMADKGGLSFNSLEEGLQSFSEKVMKKLCSDLRVPENKFFVCPGNHEVCRDAIDKELDYKLEHSLDTEEKLHRFLVDNRKNPGYTERLKKYDDSFRQSWLKQVKSNSAESYISTVNLADHFIVEVDGRKIGISCLNSAWRCGAKLNQKKNIEESWKKCPKWIKKTIKSIGLTPAQKEVIEYKEIKGEYNAALIGAAQMTDACIFFDKADVALRLSLAHHHFSVLGQADWQSLNNVFRHNYDMCFFGHTHGHHTDQHSNPDGNMICSIAPSTKRENEQTVDGYKNGFSLWDIDIAKGTAKEQKFFLHLGTEFNPDMFPPHTYLLDTRFIYPLSEFLKNFKRNIDIDSDSLADLRKKIIDSQSHTLLVYGVSGIGKTYQVSKALSQINGNSKSADEEVFYCEAKIDDNGQLFDDFTKRLTDFFIRHKDAYLILDNCNVNVLQSVMNERKKTNSAVKIIGLTNLYDEHDFKFSGIETIMLSAADSKQAVDKYIDDHISDLRIRESLKRYASGFPIIAIKLVGQVLKDKKLSLDPESVGMDSLIRSLGRDIKESKDLEELLMAMALFQPFPKLSDDSMDIWRMKSLSSLHSKSREEIVALIDKALSLWHGTLVESTPSGYTIRPYLLSVHLASLWFEKNNTEEHFKRIIKDLSSLKDGDRGMAVKAFSRRLEELNKSEAANRLFKILNEESGFFRSENVVFSTVGSQLILAAANVNPASVALSLRSVISMADEKTLRGLHYMVRRNLVSALTSLVFYDDSFEDSMVALAVLAYYEEENILNNATQTFQSTFHIILPGTQSSLEKRVLWLKKYSASDSRIKELLPIALKGAFSVGMFSRLSYFGAADDVKSDYEPTYGEIREYWRLCTELAVSEIDEGKNIDLYVDIVNSNIHFLASRRLLPYVIDLIEKVSVLKNDGWKILENDYNDVIKTLKEGSTDKDIIDRFEKLKDVIVLSDFLSKLQSRQKDYYESSYSASDFETEIQFYLPLVNELIDGGGYKDNETISALLTDRQFVYFSFCVGISRVIQDSQLAEMFDSILSSAVLTDNLVSPFLLSLVSCTRERSSVSNFTERLYERGFNTLYTALLARLEDDNLSSWKLLEDKFATAKFNFCPVYLNHVSASPAVLSKLLPILDVKMKENINEVMFFLVIHYSFPSLSDEASSYCKDMVMKFDLGGTYPNLTHSYCNFICKLLKAKRDDVFAKNISKKLLSAPDESYESHSFSSVFKIILEDYLEEGITPLLEAMMQAPFHSVPYRLAEDLGSGFGFGKGAFFSLEKEYLSRLLDKYGVKLARVYAKMCPVFPKEPNDSPEFSEWIPQLLDKYGDDEEMRGNLSANMGSFTWSGSVIPLLDAKIRGFKRLQNLDRPEVRDWVNANLEQLRLQRDYETVVEDFRKQLYE